MPPAAYRGRTLQQGPTWPWSCRAAGGVPEKRAGPAGTGPVYQGRLQGSLLRMREQGLAVGGISPERIRKGRGMRKVCLREGRSSLRVYRGVNLRLYWELYQGVWQGMYQGVRRRRVYLRVHLWIQIPRLRSGH